MIQEPLTNLEQILQEPVFKISGQAPALKRLTVKLVAFEPSSLKVPTGETKSLLPVAKSNPFTPLPDTNDESEEDEDWFYSNDETPTASFYTPQPEPDFYTPAVEHAWISDPALPIFSPDLAYFGDESGYAVRLGNVEQEWEDFGIEDEMDDARIGRDTIQRSGIVSSSPSGQRAMVLSPSGQRAMVSSSLSIPSLSSPSQTVSRVRHFDATLLCLTVLLLLGILGGIGFGYLLTLVNQG